MDHTSLVVLSGGSPLYVSDQPRSIEVATYRKRDQPTLNEVVSDPSHCDMELVRHTQMHIFFIDGGRQICCLQFLRDGLEGGVCV